MNNALAIAASPVDGWAPRIAQLPVGCPHGGAIGCQARIADYLRIQWRMLQRRQAAGVTA